MNKKTGFLISMIPVAMILVYAFSLIESRPVQIIAFAGVMVFSFFACGYLIIESKRVNKNILVNEERYKIALSHVSKVLFDNILDADITTDSLIGANCDALTTLLGIQKNATFTETINKISKTLTHPDFAEVYRMFFSRENIMENYERGQKYIELECIELSDGLKYNWICIHVCIYKSEITNTIRIISYVKNIDEQKRAILELMKKTQLDSLTGVLNKHSTKESVTEILQDSHDRIHVGMMIDFDNFKQINDSYGHAFGDMVIVQAAQRIKAQFREHDIVGRIGGDEFFIFMDDVPNIAYAVSKAEQVCNSFHDFEVKDIDNRCKLSVSIGVCMKYGSAEFGELYHEADVALYKAKSKGKNGYFINELS